MTKNLFISATLLFALPAPALAQNSNTGAAPSTQPAREAAPAAGRQATPRAPARTTAAAAQSSAVREAFDSLVDGIRRADAGAVAALYWNSPQLLVFNNNGTVTKSWEQARSNRESLYAKVSDVKLDVRDVRVKTLGPSAAVVTCLWEQSQTADGQPERATGRLTIVYQKIGAAWKIVHTHTSPDKPSPSNLLPSERTPAGAEPAPARPPAKP
ncbi:MAG: nuclear transport factor 2 family protein [Acidobacteria bacterium]|nr:nuclear transport factor 2 family protein [Acidobacteriota bacterium]